jgi:hypothetical protein
MTTRSDIMSDEQKTANREALAKAMSILNDDNDDVFGTPAYDLASWAAWQAMDSGQREVLRQLVFFGPVYDGDIASKSARDTLFPLGLAVRCAHKGDHGYTAATYTAVTVFRAGTGRRTANPKVREVEVHAHRLTAVESPAAAAQH